MIVLGADVGAALAAGGPVVALETTIITHGLPWPANMDAARRFEQAVRDEGATPATIGVVAGRAHVGLGEAPLEALARGGVEKIQASTLPLAVSGGLSGGTTVSATLHLAHRVGIRVFATGGIGGVHRGAHESGDVSEDLAALARTPVAVVSSGAKAILDLPRTLEALESLGIAVVGLGTDEFPAFYTPHSGLHIARVENAASVAAIMRAAWRDLQMDRGLLVCNPPPPDVALPREQMEGWIAGALTEAAAAGVRGKAVTPRLLDALERASGGATVATNIALAESNARVAARIAIAYGKN